MTSDPIAEKQQMVKRVIEATSQFKEHIKQMEKEGKLPPLQLPMGLDASMLKGFGKMFGQEIDLSYSGMISKFADNMIKMAEENPQGFKEMAIGFYDMIGYIVGYTDQVGG